MGSYSPQVLPAPDGAIGGFSKGIAPYLEAYAKGAQRKKLDEQEIATKQSRYDKSKQAAIAKGLKIEETMSSSGPSWKQVQEKPITPADIGLLERGLDPNNKAPEIAKQYGASPYEVVGMKPEDVNVDANFKEIPVEPKPEDYRRYAQGALKANPAVNRGGAEPLPDEFKLDLKVAADASKGNEDVLVAQLKDLHMKYGDNKAARAAISELLRGRGTKKQSGRPSRK